STKQKHQRRWTPSRPRKKSCSASTCWKRTVTRCASHRRVSRVPPNSVPLPGVATFSHLGSGRRSNKQDAAATFAVASITLRRRDCPAEQDRGRIRRKNVRL